MIDFYIEQEAFIADSPALFKAIAKATLNSSMIAVNKIPESWSIP